MAWNTAEPQDTTKIRNLGVVIRPNWLAVEQADTTFVPQAFNALDRTAAALPGDPAALANGLRIYSKQDGAGNPQLYCEDTGSLVEQLTRFQDFTAGRPGHSYLLNDILVQWNRFQTVAATTQTVNFPIAYSATAFIVLAALETQTGSARAFVNLVDGSVTAAGFQLNTRDQSNNNLGNNKFIHWLAIGPK